MTARGHRGARRLGPGAGRASIEIAFTPSRVLMQDFTGVPAIVDLAAMRDAIEAAGRRPDADQPAGAGRAGDRPLDPGRRVRRAARVPAQRRARVRAQPRALRVPALGPGRRSTTSPSCRRTPGICHQVNLEYLAKVVHARDGQAFPDTLVGTDSHTTMVNGLGVLGWGVGGIEAEAAMLGQPVSMLIPRGGRLPADRRAAGGRDGHRPRPDRHADAAPAARGEQVRRVLRPGAGEPAAGRPRDDRQHVAGVRRDVRDLPGRRRDAALPASSPAARPSRWSSSRPTAARRACSTSRARRSRCSPTRSSSTWRPSSRAWPGRAGRRTASRSATRRADFREELRTFVSGEAYQGWDTSAALTFPASDPPSSKAEGVSPKPLPRAPRRRRAGRARARRRRGPGSRRGGDRRDHELHEHVEPVGHARRRAAGPQGGRGGPDAAAVGEDEPRAGLEGRHRVPRARGADRAARAARVLARRLRLHDVHRQLRAAAGGDLARDRRARPDRLLGAVGQPQLRGAHPPRGQDELPRQPAARAWPTRWRGGWTSTSRASRCRATCAWPTSGRRSARSADAIEQAVESDMFRRSYGEVFAGDENWNAPRGPGRRPLRLGSGVDVRQAPALLRRHGRRARGRASAGSPARGRSRCWATASPPTTSRPPARSRATRRPGATCPSTASSAATSTPTARGAATTR